MSWADVSRAFEELLELPHDRRDARLAAWDASDPELANEVRALLAHDRQATCFLERWSASDVDMAADSFEATPGLQFGPYRLERHLGSGGMGTVWQAVRTNPDRTVALKILAEDDWSPARHARFEYEVQVLAALNHPNIARLFDAATHTRDGRRVAWFAMELVEGARDVTTWADERQLDTQQRIALFRELCEAVQYGHRRGVIHRDLKPSNILVDGDGKVKLIDFGVARAIEGSPTERAPYTLSGELVGTLQYMAPEQVAGRAREVDVRCDVYSLGTVLYRLLCGGAPFDFNDIALPEIVRIVRDQEPKRPSEWNPALAGDLEWILLRALERDPARRYRDVEQLVEDLRRYEADEPVLAREPTRTYRLVKFVRRNRVLLGIAATLLLGIALALGGVTAGLVRAREGERVAALEAERGRQIFGLIEGLFEGIQDTVDGREVRVVDLLESAELTPGSAELSDPVVEFTVRMVRGKIFERLSLYEPAYAELKRALDVLPDTERHPEELDRWLQARSLLGTTLTQLGSPQEGERLLRETLELAEQAGSDPVEAGTRLELVAYLIKSGAFDEALEHATILRELADEVDNVDLRTTADDLIAGALSGLGRTEDAARAYEALWKDCEARKGEHDLSAIFAMKGYLACLIELERFDEADELYPHLIARTRHVRGPGHADTLGAMNDAAAVAFSRGDLEAATEQLHQIVDAYDEMGEPPDVGHITAISNLGMTYFQRMRWNECEDVLARAHRLATELFDPQDLKRAQIAFNYGSVLTQIDQFEAGERLMLESFSMFEQLLPPDHPILKRTMHTLEDSYELNGRPEEAAYWRERR